MTDTYRPPKRFLSQAEIDYWYNDIPIPKPMPEPYPHVGSPNPFIKTSFIERHGLIQYDVNINRYYPYLFSCDMKACIYFEKQEAAYAKQRIKEIAREINNPEYRRDSAIDYLSYIQQMHDYYINLINTQSTRSRHFYFDHCHIHGWIRGEICVSCNNVLGYIDNKRKIHNPRGYPFDVINKYISNCPGCFSESI
jgi:hypothetical protein